MCFCLMNKSVIKSHVNGRISSKTMRKNGLQDCPYSTLKISLIAAKEVGLHKDWKVGLLSGKNNYLYLTYAV